MGVKMDKELLIMTNVIKRNGKEVKFDIYKIIHAMEKANKEVAPVYQMNEYQIQAAAETVAKKIQASSHAVNVEDIQDMVETAIMEMRAYEVAQKYVRYRYKREMARKANSTDEDILALIDQANEELKQENSNKNPVINSTQRDYMAGEVSKDLTRRLLLPEDIVKAHEEGVIHFHDSDYYAQKEHNCDFIISVGGGSPQDAASCISVIATNGGKPQDYEGLHKSAQKGLPVVAINTTAGTSAEITINYVITDEERKVKMVMVDKNSLALISVNDPELMVSKPQALTAATGMDALTHAVEALVTPGAYDVTKKLSIGAIELIKEYLPRAVENGHDIEAREGMVNAIFLGGMSFNNAGLGYVHSMAHQLGAVYNLPHGVCCAMLLPVVERENAKRVPVAFRNVAKALGMQIEGKSDEECAAYAISEIEKLSETVGIPKKLTELGIEEKDFDFEYLSKNALIDACAPGNPFMPTLEETIAFYKELF